MKDFLIVIYFLIGTLISISLICPRAQKAYGTRGDFILKDYVGIALLWPFVIGAIVEHLRP